MSGYETRATVEFSSVDEKPLTILSAVIAGVQTMIRLREFKKEDVGKINAASQCEDFNDLRERMFSFTLFDDSTDVIIGCGGLDRVYEALCLVRGLYLIKDACLELKNVKRAIREIRLAIDHYIAVNPIISRVHAEVIDEKRFVSFAKLCGFKVEAILGNMHYSGKDLVIMRYK